MIRAESAPATNWSRTLTALGLLTMLVTGGCGGGGGGSSSGGDGGGPVSGPPGTLQLLETNFDTTEGATVNVQVARSGGSSGEVSVDYTTADESAEAGSDYTAASGTLMWADGVSGNRTISIPILDDDLEESAESFALTLSNVSGATLGASTTATVTVAANDASARLSDLSFSAGQLDQAFQPTLMSYTATVGFLLPTTAVVPTSEDPNATVAVNGVLVPSGQSSDKITLSEGTTAIEIVVTAADEVSSETYLLDITRESVTSFAQQAYIKASNTDEDDLFSSVALSGNTLVVGAPGEASAATGIGGDQDDNSADDAGAVYLFMRDGAGVWSQHAYIKASHTGPLDRFGEAVSLEGDTLVVGAGGEGSAATGIDGDQNDNSADGAGAVYVFTRDLAGIWSQQAYIKSSNTDPADGFGSWLALSGDTLAVTAPGERSTATGIDGDQSDDSAADAGAVYVFTRDGAGVWSQQAYVKASNTDAGDVFGKSVALEGDTLVVGAQGEASAADGIGGDQSDNSINNAGAVYVFTRDLAGIWSQQAYVKSSNPSIEGDLFGDLVALSGATLVVSSPLGIAHPGEIYVFTRDQAGTWSQQAKITDSEGFEIFASSMVLSGDTLAVGVAEEYGDATGVNGDQNGDVLPYAGAVYVFTRNDTGIWSKRAYIKASNPAEEDFFGRVALSGATLAVGASGEASAATGIDGDQSDNSRPNAGAVYMFE